MEIRAEVCGWFKRVNAPDDCVKRGYIDLAFLPPLNVLTPPFQRLPTPDDLAGTTVRLYHVGTTEDNRPWFRHE